MAPINPLDVPNPTWIDQRVPPAVQPYLKLMRLDRPIGTWLLLLPCWWGLAAAWPRIAGDPASVAGTVLLYGGLFALGAVVMRGAGCTVNDILDRDLDAQVARTRLRPIPSGQVSVRAAAAFLVGLLLLGLLVLVQFNGSTILIGASSLVLVATYPLMKRITHWPQAFLGLTFNWGALVGWSAVTGGLAPTALLIYAAGLFWTLGYDTIYAHQDKEDDARIGVKSTALRLGAASKAWIAGFYLAMAGLLAAALVSLGAGAVAYGPLALGGLFLAMRLWRWAPGDAEDCLARFKEQKWFGLLVVAAFALAPVA